MTTTAEMMKDMERFEAVMEETGLEPKEVPKWLFSPWIGEKSQAEPLQKVKKCDPECGLGYNQYEL